jgi:hypothetical protein
MVEQSSLKKEISKREKERRREEGREMRRREKCSLVVCYSPHIIILDV